jgi:hypothetical protein
VGIQPVLDRDANTLVHDDSAVRQLFGLIFDVSNFARTDGVTIEVFIKENLGNSATVLANAQNKSVLPILTQPIDIFFRHKLNSATIAKNAIILFVQNKHTFQK